MSYYRRNKDWSDLGCFGWFLVILLLIALVWLDVFISCLLWGVIAVGVFGLPALTMWQMFGLILLLHFILPSTTIRSSN